MDMLFTLIISAAHQDEDIPVDEDSPQRWAGFCVIA